MGTEKKNLTKRFTEEDFENSLDFEEDLDDDDFDESFSDIISSNTIHDRSQFESKFDFELKPNANNSQKDYNIDVYFFIPNNVGINSETYKSEKFFNNLTNYQRIRTPYLFTMGEKLTLKYSDLYFKNNLDSQKRKNLEEAVIQEVKFFGCYLNTSLKRLKSTYRRVFRKNKSNKKEKVKLALIQRLSGIEKTVDIFRENYVSKIRNNEVLANKEVKKVFLLVDEYISYRLEIVMIQFINYLDKKKLAISDLKDVVNHILKKETIYRSKSNIINLDNEDNEAVKEGYYYRLGLLKKYILEVLYLQSKVIKKEKFYKNVVAATGAGLAATVAGLAEAQRIHMATNMDGDLVLRFILILFLGVLAYIFKDRVKDLTKEYFNQRLKTYLPDFDIKMFYTSFGNDGKKIKRELGSSKEFMRYLKKENIPQEVNYIRNIGNRSELDPERNETILHYSKSINFDLEKINQGLSNVQYIRDISRFGLRDYLTRLDDPNKIIKYFSEDNGIVSIKAPKVYHVNIVFCYAYSYSNKKNVSKRNVQFERVRVILNKKGIVRIEEVLNRRSISYKE